MTEPDQEPNPAPSEEPEQVSGPDAPLKPGAETPAPADAAWPKLPSGLAAGDLSGDPSGPQARVHDPAVGAVLGRLAAVPFTPVSGHGEVYAGMHDALLEALNEDVASHAGTTRRIHTAGDGGA